MGAKFDVAITSYRRPDMTLAAVRSCLAQGDLLRRVVVVDDASGDDTPARLAALGDPRVVVHVRAVNGGIGAARRDAFERCSAEWTVMIDSDHELLPGALGKLDGAIQAVPAGVGIVGARFRWDTGEVTPHRVPRHLVDYRERIRLSALPDGIGRDYLLCVSRRVREGARWAVERSGMTDTLFQLDAAKLADAHFLEDCLAYQKSNGAEGHSRGTIDHLLARRRKDAAGGVALCRRILERHGAALRAFGPSLLAGILKHGAICAALEGRRLLAARWALAGLRAGGPGRVPPALVPACLAGPTVFALAYRRSLRRGGALP
jgi:glycosyltransferase involved in cell wall biosynthesis